MSRSNADRQRAYRDRRRNERNAAAMPILPSRSVRGQDYRDDRGEHIYLGNWGNGEDVYALVVNKRRA